MKRFLGLNRTKILGLLLCVCLVFMLSGCSSDQSAVSSWKDMTFFGKFFVWPVMWLMYWIGKGLGSSYAWGLIITTIIVRTIAWPIYAKTNSWSIKMNLAQPDLEAIQRKYAGRKDPESQNRMQQETMKVYKKYGINPLGCLIVFLQMPIFIAVYQSVTRINKAIIAPALSSCLTGQVSMYGKFHLGNTSLFGLELEYSVMNTIGTKDIGSMIFGIVLAILVGVTMWLSQKQASKKPSYSKNIPAAPNSKTVETQKQMKMMNTVMIAMMVFMSLSSNALALYWVLGTLYSIGQNLIGRKLNERKYYKLQEKNNLL